MRKVLAGVVLALGLMVGTSAGASTSSAPPPDPAPWEPSSITGCWKSVLERHVERRTVKISGHTFVEFRRVTTYLRKCSEYVVVTWHSPWGPGRR